MSNLQSLKREFTDTNIADWGIFRDPPVWANSEDGFSIQVAKPFEEDNLHAVTNNDLGTVFGKVDRGLGNIRIEYRGVPFYEADCIVVGIRDERRYFHHSVTSVGADLNDFEVHLGRAMTEALGYHEYDDVLETVEQSDSLGS